MNKSDVLQNIVLLDDGENMKLLEAICDIASVLKLPLCVCVHVLIMFFE